MFLCFATACGRARPNDDAVVVCFHSSVFMYPQYSSFLFYTRSPLLMKQKGCLCNIFSPLFYGSLTRTSLLVFKCRCRFSIVMISFADQNCDNDDDDGVCVSVYLRVSFFLLLLELFALSKCSFGIYDLIVPFHYGSSLLSPLVYRNNMYIVVICVGVCLFTCSSKNTLQPNCTS